MPFCVWLLAFIMFSRLVHIVAYISISYLFMAEQYSIAWIYYSSFIHSSVDEHLGCFCLFIIVNNAARMIWQFYVCFWGTVQLSSKGATPFYNLSRSVWEFQFLHQLLTLSFYILGFLLGKVISSLQISSACLSLCYPFIRSIFLN